jgi:uncharacterized protein YkwD
MSRLMTLMLFAFAALLFAPASAFARDESQLGCGAQMPATAIDGPAWTQQIINRVNAERTFRGLTPVQSEAVLTRAAAWKARDVAARRLVNGHDDPGMNGLPGRTIAERFETCGIPASTASENLLVHLYATDPNQVVDWWMNSAGHRANILNPAWRFIGVGTASYYIEDAPGERFTAFTQVFASQRPPVPYVCGGGFSTLTGRSVDIAKLTCRAGGDPVIVKAPTAGALAGTIYRAPSTPTWTSFTIRWPDTGNLQRFDVVVSPARVVGSLSSITCTGRSCAVRYGVSPRGYNSVRMQVQRRVGSTWRFYRAYTVPMTGSRATIRLATGGTFRVRTFIDRLPAQTVVHSAWRTVRVR